MTNAKIRHWIYVAIGFLILCGAAYFLLLRDSRYSDTTAAGIFAEHQSAYAEVVSYMKKKEIVTVVPEIPTIDHRYGIVPEDTDPYRAFLDAMTELLNTDVDEIKSDEETVQFVLNKSGGLLINEQMIIICGEAAPPTIDSAPRSELPEKNWYYYIRKE